MTLARRFAAFTVISLSLAACADGADGAEVDPLPADFADGKSDRGSSSVQHGELPLVDGHEIATISDDEPVHAWKLTLSGEATVTVDTDISGFGAQVDTVIYLYRVGGSGVVAKNDNAKRGVTFSKLERTLDVGQYWLVVKGKYDDSRGDIIVNARCDGDGCEGPTGEDAIEWLEQLAETYDSEGGAGFDEVDPDDLPEAVRASYDAHLEENPGDAATVTAYESEIGDGERAWLIEVMTETWVYVEIYGPDGDLEAFGRATESSAIEWARN